MSVYNIQHIINEIIDERSKMTSTKSGSKVLQTDAKVEIYWETWAILIAWIESQLAKKAGATLPLLGSFTWEVRDSLFRPIFLLSDQFIKTYNVKQQKSHKKLNTVPSEDINYSKLAIKFSTALTKDMVFSGVRDIVKRISTFFERGYETEVDFTFGILKFKDKRVKFEFNQGRLKKIMPSNAFDNVVMKNDNEEEAKEKIDEEQDSNSVDLYEEPQNSFRSTMYTSSAHHQGASSAANDASKSYIPKLDTSIFQNTARVEAALSGAAENSSSNNISNSNHNNKNTTFGNSFENTAVNTFTHEGKTFNERPISPGLERVLKMLGDEEGTFVGNKAERRQRLVEKVTEDSYLRMLASVENLAANEDEIRTKAYQLHKDWLNSEKKKNEDNKNTAVSMKSTLDNQVTDFKSRMAIDRQNRMNAVAACIVKQTEYDDDNSPASILRRKTLSNELQSQIMKNSERKLETKLRSLQEEKEYLDHVAMEIDMQYAAERSAHLEKQRTLLEAWEREGHIRNLKKLQSCGASTVSDYVNNNLGIDTSTIKKDMSIGFDARKDRKDPTKVGGNSFGFDSMKKKAK